MSFAGVRIGTGTRFVYDGEVIEVVEIHAVNGPPEVLAREVRTEVVRRIALNELMFSPQARLLSDSPTIASDAAHGMTASLAWSAASESARCEARGRAAHVREVLTGYRSGTASVAAPESRERVTCPI